MPTLQKYRARLHSRLYAHLRSQALMDIYVMRMNQADVITIHLYPLRPFQSRERAP